MKLYKSHLKTETKYWPQRNYAHYMTDTIEKQCWQLIADNHINIPIFVDDNKTISETFTKQEFTK